MICTLSRHAATDAGFDDAMMFDWRGQIAEGTGANIFFVRDGVLHTPTPDCFLNGLTRQTVIELAKQRGIEVVERAIWPNELASFSRMRSSPAPPPKSPRSAKSPACRSSPRR